LLFAITSEVVALFGLALGLLFVTGVVQSGRMAMQSSLTLEYVDPEYRGRVMSLSSMGWSLMPVAVLPLTVLMDRLGAGVGLGLIAVVFVLVSIIIVASSSRLRSLQ